MPSVALNLVLGEARVYSGDVLQATVLLDSGDPDTVIHEFVAEIRGVGRTGWVNIHTDKIYETEQEYLNIFLPLCLVGQPQPLKPGRHKFSLRVAIPDNMPSSYESQFGSIRYTCKVTLLTNSENSSVAEVFPFMVVSRSYFEDIPQAIMQNIDYKDEIDFTVCSLPFGTIFLCISLPRTAYHLGETIPARIHVKNATRKALKECRLQFLCKTQFEAKSRYEHANDRKLVEAVLDTWPIGKIKGRTEADFDDCCLRVRDNVVPTHQPSTSQPGTEFEMNIIVISYVLRFNAEPGIETEIPLIITSEGYHHGSNQQSNVQCNNNIHKQSLGDYNENMLESASSSSSPPPRQQIPGNRRNTKRVSIFENPGGALYYC